MPEQQASAVHGAGAAQQLHCSKVCCIFAGVGALISQGCFQLLCKAEGKIPNCEGAFAEAEEPFKLQIFEHVENWAHALALELLRSQARCCSVMECLPTSQDCIGLILCDVAAVCPRCPRQSIASSAIRAAIPLLRCSIPSLASDAVPLLHSGDAAAHVIVGLSP